MKVLLWIKVVCLHFSQNCENPFPSLLCGKNCKDSQKSTKLSPEYFKLSGTCPPRGSCLRIPFLHPNWDFSHISCRASLKIEKKLTTKLRHTKHFMQILFFLICWFLTLFSTSQLPPPSHGFFSHCYYQVFSRSSKTAKLG